MTEGRKSGDSPFGGLPFAGLMQWKQLTALAAASRSLLPDVPAAIVRTVTEQLIGRRLTTRVDGAEMALTLTELDCAVDPLLLAAGRIGDVRIVAEDLDWPEPGRRPSDSPPDGPDAGGSPTGLASERLERKQGPDTAWGKEKPRLKFGRPRDKVRWGSGKHGDPDAGEADSARREAQVGALPPDRRPGDRADPSTRGDEDDRSQTGTPRSGARETAERGTHASGRSRSETPRAEVREPAQRNTRDGASSRSRSETRLSGASESAEWDPHGGADGRSQTEAEPSKANEPAERNPHSGADGGWQSERRASRTSGPAVRSAHHGADSGSRTETRPPRANEPAEQYPHDGADGRSRIETRPSEGRGAANRSARGGAVAHSRPGAQLSGSVGRVPLRRVVALARDVRVRSLPTPSVIPAEVELRIFVGGDAVRERVAEIRPGIVATPHEDGLHVRWAKRPGWGRLTLQPSVGPDAVVLTPTILHIGRWRLRAPRRVRPLVLPLPELPNGLRLTGVRMSEDELVLETVADEWPERLSRIPLGDLLGWLTNAALTSTLPRLGARS